MRPSQYAVSVGGASAADYLYAAGAQQAAIENRSTTLRQLAALRYCIRALQDMPGRKSLMFMSPRIEFTLDPFDTRLLTPAFTEPAFNAVADQALRAGVVIFTLDMKGLGVISGVSKNSKYLPLSKKTGGIIVENSNFFVSGIRPVEELLKGYYLLSFVPPADTFAEKQQEIYHRISVKTTRSGMEVRTRDGYFGVAGRPADSTAAMDALQKSIISPFLYNDLQLRMSSGYVQSPAPGYLVRSWLHLDGKDLTLIDENNGGHSLSLELVALATNAGGIVQDLKSMRYAFQVNNKEVSWLREYGLDFDMYLPIKKPGDYYVRTAVRDKASGKIGSAYQFLEIPDLEKSRLALSSIFVFNQAADISVVRSGNLEEDGKAIEAVRQWQVTRNSPALRIYWPGDMLYYIAWIYAPKSSPTNSPGFESQVTLLKDGKEFYKGAVEDVDVKGTDSFGRIPVAKRLTFDPEMGEGEYVLRLTIADKAGKKKSTTVAQAFDFEILRGAPSRASD
jgi:hypothetical protein